MKTLKRIFLSVMLLGIVLPMMAQSAELTGVRKREFRGVFPILNKETRSPEGYYSFYVNEKESQGMINFVIAIFDTDMKLIKQTPISMTKRSEVDGAEFNGKYFLFAFNDWMKKTLSYVTVDRQGNVVKTLGIVEESRWSATSDIYPAGEGGFFIVKPIRESRMGYSIEMVDHELRTVWENRFLVDRGGLYPDAIEVGNGRIVVIQTNWMPGFFNAKVEAKLVCLDGATGQQLFTFPLYDGLTTAMPSSFIIDAEKNIVSSGMYFEGANWDAINSDGIFFLKLSPNGEVVYYNQEDWDEGIQRAIKDATKKRLAISSKPKVFFHTIVQAPDGGYQVVGETFRKSYQLVSSALVDAISGRYIGYIDVSDDNEKPITFEVLDFIVFDFDASGKMRNINIIEKEHTKISCYSPYNGMGGLRLARYVAKFGFFNYAFMASMPNGQEYIVSSNFVKKPYIGFTTIKSGEESTTKQLPVTRMEIKGGGIGVMPHIGSNVAIYIYDKKQEIVTIYVEPVNF